MNAYSEQYYKSLEELERQGLEELAEDIRSGEVTYEAKATRLIINGEYGSMTPMQNEQAFKTLETLFEHQQLKES